MVWWSGGLVAVLAEMYVQGVSARKVKAVTEELCGHSFSASVISEATARLDTALAAFAERRLAEREGTEQATITAVATSECEIAQQFGGCAYGGRNDCRGTLRFVADSGASCQDSEMIFDRKDDAAGAFGIFSLNLSRWGGLSSSCEPLLRSPRHEPS